MPTAIGILKNDHMKAKRLFGEVENAKTDEECDRKWQELATDLRAHVTLEKEVFYPAIRAAIPDDLPADVMDGQEEEETEGTAMLEELDGDTLEGDAWMAKFREFKDIVLKHATEAEEGKLFPILERKMTARQLEDLGVEMERRHKELHQKLEAKAR